MRSKELSQNIIIEFYVNQYNNIPDASFTIDNEYNLNKYESLLKLLMNNKNVTINFNKNEYKKYKDFIKPLEFEVGNLNPYTFIEAKRSEYGENNIWILVKGLS